MAQNLVINLECPSCGGQTELSPDGMVAVCAYCGGRQVIQQAGAQFDRLKDFPNASFNVRHAAPRLSLDEAKAKILAGAKDDPIGFHGIDGVAIDVHGSFLPVWFIECKVHCTWTGKYSTSQKITRWRTVTRTRTVGDKVETYTDNEPFEDVETTWHQCNGVHDFSNSTLRFADETPLDQESVPLFRGIRDLTSTAAGFPAPIDGFTFVPAVQSERKAWSNWEEEIQRWGEQECSDATEKVERVTATLAGVDFSLVYLPVGSIAYEINGREYQHRYDLAQDILLGDLIPLDPGAIDIQGLKTAASAAALSQAKINEITSAKKALLVTERKRVFGPAKLWLWIGIPSVCLGLYNLSELPYLAWVLLGGGLVAIGSGVYCRLRGAREFQSIKERIEAEIPKDAPWQNFVTDRRTDLIRAARLACAEEGRDGQKIETFGVLTDLEDFGSRHERHHKLKELEVGTPESVSAAESVARALLLGAASPKPPVIGT